jgi:mono/diheme cytochrome c family protein
MGMGRGAKAAWGVVVVAALGVGVATLQVIRHGVSCRDEPTALEVVLARQMRHLAIPRAARDTRNPTAASPEVLADARAHFADHCASCHGNDGKGQTELGRNLYPKAPDMTLPATQRLSDGEIFAIIENGVRLTGMPAWGQGTAESSRDTWKLVHFIRHLPQITPQELADMKAWNPKSKDDLEEEEAERRFLAGEDEPPPTHGH